MKTYLIFIMMQLAIIPVTFAQRGGGGHGGGGGNSGGHSGGGGYSGGRSGGGVSAGRSNGGGRFNGGPGISHSFGGRSYSAPGNRGYAAAPAYRGGGYATPPIYRGGGYATPPSYRGRYGYNYGHGYYGRDGFYGHGYGYGSRLFGPAYYRNWAFGWGLGYWNVGLWWQTAFYLDLYNCYESGSYYAPGYYNSYVSDFNYLVQTINNQQGDDNKMTVAKEAIDQRNVSSDQVARIMQCFESDEARVDFAIYAYPHVSDKRNFYRVNNSFRNPESAQQLGGYLDSQYGSHANPGNQNNQYQGNPGNQQGNPGYQQNNPGNQNNNSNPPVPPNPPIQPQH